MKSVLRTMLLSGKSTSTPEHEFNIQLRLESKSSYMKSNFIRKSREKAKMKQLETKQRVDGLKEDNQNLELKVQTLKVSSCRVRCEPNSRSVEGKVYQVQLLAVISGVVLSLSCSERPYLLARIYGLRHDCITLYLTAKLIQLYL